MDDMGLEEEWLSQILGVETRKHYSRAIAYFKQFLKCNSVEKVINLAKKERHFETAVLMFYKWLQTERSISANSSRAYVIAVQSLCTYVGIPLRLKNKLPKMHMKVENWKPSLDDLQRIYKLNDLSVKAWMSLSRDCPARMSDLLKITSEQILKGGFLLLSKKENVTGKVYVSDETKILFRQLKKARIELPKSQRGIDKMMENACKVAGLERRINQHLFRKLWISAAINLGLNEVIIKVLTFKTVPQEMLTYFLDREDLRTSWKRVIDTMPLEIKSTPETTGQIEGFKNAIIQLSNENQGLKVRVDILQEKLDGVLYLSDPRLKELLEAIQTALMSQKETIRNMVMSKGKKMGLKITYE